MRFRDRFSNLIKGVLTGFDRLVFRGHLLQLMYPRGMMRFLSDQDVLLKNYIQWAKPRTEAIKDRFYSDAQSTNNAVNYIRSPSLKKEDYARCIQESRDIKSGVICSLSCVEPSKNMIVRKNHFSKLLEIRREQGQCMHLYRYYDHEKFGFMHVRLQTWFPFSIQICLNGREYLKRRLENKGIDFEMYDNSFTKLSDWSNAQILFDHMKDINWTRELELLTRNAFPNLHKQIGDLSYSWSVYQSEWATDHTFESPETAKAIFDVIQRHAILNSNTASVLKFFGNHVSVDGIAHGKLGQQVTSRIVRRSEGTCVKHRVGSNGVKTYNKYNNIRVESTINRSRVFKAPRTYGKDKRPKLRPIRESVVDIKNRINVSDEINNRYLEHLSSASTQVRLGEIAERFAHRHRWHGDYVRGLDLTSKDRYAIEFLSNPTFTVQGFRNTDLRRHLSSSESMNGKSKKQLASKATRCFRLLRAHGLIERVPKENCYRLTSLGNAVISTVKCALSATAESLIQMVA